MVNENQDLSQDQNFNRDIYGSSDSMLGQSKRFFSGGGIGGSSVGMFFLGLATGSIVTMLMDPVSGNRRRSMMKDRAMDMTSNIPGLGGRKSNRSSVSGGMSRDMSGIDESIQQGAQTT